VRRVAPRRVVMIGVGVLAGWGLLWLARPTDSPPDVMASPSPTPSASPSALVLGVPPVVTGGLALCPFDAPYRAYVQPGRHFYPPNHPLLPSLDVLPDRCFATPEEAERAGFSLALAQQFSQVVDGVYLLTIYADRIGRSCVRAAFRLGFSVPCPLVLPNPGPGVADPACGQSILGNQGCIYARETFVLEQSGFAVPPGYGEGPQGFGPQSDLVVAAYPTSLAPSPQLLEGFSDPAVALGCPDATPVDEEPTIGLPEFVDRLQFLECPVDFYPPIGGSEILRWHSGRITYQVSILGLTETNRRIAEVIVANMTLVMPA
jgi:hypothetical protein